MAERIYLRKFEGGKWRTGSVASEASAAQMQDAGWQPITAEAYEDIKRVRNASGVAGAATAALDTLSVVGAASLAQTELFGRDPKDVAAEREAAGAAGDVAAIAGAVAPALLTGGAGALGAAARLTPAGRLAAAGTQVAKGTERVLGGGTAAKLAGAGVGTAYEGAVYGAGMTLSERAMGAPEITGERLLQSVAGSAGIAGVLGVAGRGGMLAAPAVGRAAQQGLAKVRELGGDAVGLGVGLIAGPRAGFAARALARRGGDEAALIAEKQGEIAGLRKLISQTNDDIARTDIDVDLLGTRIDATTEAAGRLRAGADTSTKRAGLAAEAARKQAKLTSDAELAGARGSSLRERGSVENLDAKLTSARQEVRAFQEHEALGKAQKYADLLEGRADDIDGVNVAVDEAQRRFRYYAAKATIYRGEALKLGVGKSAARNELIKKAEQADLRAAQFRERLDAIQPGLQDRIAGMEADASYALTRANVADAQAAKLRAQIHAAEAKQAKYMSELTEHADGIRAREADVTKLVDRQIFKNRAKSLAIDVAEGLATVGRKALPVTVARATSPEVRQSDLLKVRDRVNELSANPLLLADGLRDDDLFEIAPEAARARMITASRAVAYLKAVEPPTYRPPFSGAVELVDSFALDEYEQRVQAVADPIGVIRQGLKTGTLTTTQVECVSTVYPKQMEKIRADVLEKLGAAEKAGQSVDYATRTQLGVLLNIPLDASLLPDNYAAIQQSISYQTTANQPPKPSKNPNRPAKSGDDGRTTTQTQRREGGAV